MGGVWLNFLSQLRHEHPEMLRLVDSVRAPYRLQNGAMRQNAVSAAGEEGQQFEFFRCESDFVMAAEHPTSAVINRQITSPEPTRWCFVCREHAPKRHSDPREELFGAKRLRDVIVGAEIEGRDLVRFTAARRQDNDRHRRFAANTTGDFSAFDVGQTQIQDNQIGRMRVHDLQGVTAASYDVHVVSSRAEQGLHRALNRDFIVYEQNPWVSRHDT